MMELTCMVTVGADHPSLPGHFPGHPIVPGVVLLDLVWSEIEAALGSKSRLVAITSAKFARAVRPNEAVELSIQIEAGSEPRARFTAKVDGVLVGEGAFTLSSEPTLGPGPN